MNIHSPLSTYCTSTMTHVGISTTIHCCVLRSLMSCDIVEFLNLLATFMIYFIYTRFLVKSKLPFVIPLNQPLKTWMRLKIKHYTEYRLLYVNDKFSMDKLSKLFSCLFPINNKNDFFDNKHFLRELFFQGCYKAKLHKLAGLTRIETTVRRNNKFQKFSLNNCCVSLGNINKSFCLIIYAFFWEALAADQNFFRSSSKKDFGWDWKNLVNCSKFCHFPPKKIVLSEPRSFWNLFLFSIITITGVICIWFGLLLLFLWV